MGKVHLSEHIKIGDTLYTPMTNPSGLGSFLSFSSWAKDWLPDYLWIGIIIKNMGRADGLKCVYSIIDDLNKEELNLSKFSDIIALDDEKQEQFWDIVTKHIGIEMLAPLTVVIIPEKSKVFFNKYFNPSINIDTCLKKLLDVISECVDFHQPLTSDICYIVDYIFVKSGRLHICEGSELLVEVISNYCEYDHEDEIMKSYRPIIRSTFQGLTNVEKPNDNNFSNYFWNTLGEISECKPLVIEWETMNKEDFYKQTIGIMEYISSSNDDKKLETKYQVVMGMVCYIYRIYQEIIESKLQNSICGRILFRTMIESYINLKYLMIHEKDVPDIYDRFKAYGIGKYKLVMAKLREGKYSISDISQIDKQYLELLVNEEMDEAFIDMSVGYFEKTNIRDKFKDCDENELYEIYYEYTNNYTHGFWGAIRESTMLICDNPAHRYHSVPDYNKEQEVRSVIADAETIMRKCFGIIKTYIELPDFYTE